MTPPIPHKFLYAFLFAALALVLAAPAGARPILDGAELGDTAVPVAPDAFERAVTAQAPTTPLWEKALMARSRAMNEYYATAPQTRTITGGELVSMEQGYPVYRSGGDEPAWLKALNARSEAMNAYYGAGSTSAARPDDRGTPRPVETGIVATGGSSDGIAWSDVTVGALGGFGVALLLGLGGFALVHGSRRSSTIAH
jgi:hypothetical protein